MFTNKKAGLPTGFEVLQSFISSPAGEIKSGRDVGLVTKVEVQHGPARTQVARNTAGFLECNDGDVAAHCNRPDFTG
jgi:hypothetical protein